MKKLINDTYKAMTAKKLTYPNSKNTNFHLKSMYTEQDRYNASYKFLNDEENKGYKPVVIERIRSSHIPDIEEHIYKLRDNKKIADVLLDIRKEIFTKYDSENIMLYIGDEYSPHPNSTIGELYNKYHDVDGYMYIYYDVMPFFG